MRVVSVGETSWSFYSSRDGIPSSTPFDLLHCDFWGPSRTSSISSHRYYIVFVDEYARVSWVYLLCDRFEVITQSPTSSRKSSLNTPLRQRFFVLITLLSLSKPLYVPFALIMTLFTKPLVLIPHSKIVSQNEKIVNSLISLTHYSLRRMSHLIFV